MPADSRKVLTVAEIAEAIRVDPRTVQRWLETGILQGVRLGGVWRVRADEPKLVELMRDTDAQS